MSLRPAVGSALVVLALAAGVTPAAASSWHLQTSFGRQGVAGLPLREHGAGTLLAAGPQGSLFVGGYAHSRPGAFLLARMSSAGALVRSFGSGGVSQVPALYAFTQDPPRIFALAGGGLMIVGLDHADHLVAVRLTAGGLPDRSFGHAGVAQYAFARVHGFAVITAAAVQSNGDVLAVYQREAPQPVNEPAIPAGLGEGPIELVRLLPSGALDRSFGVGGFLQAAGRTPALGGYPGNGSGWACAQTLTPAGSLLLAYEQAIVPAGNLAEVPAVQQLAPSGADAPGFGQQGAVYLPFVPKSAQSTSSLCDGVFALPGGEVEAAFGGEGANSTKVDLFRFTAAGTLDPTFHASGYTTLAAPVAALAPGPAGEVFSAALSGGSLVLGGTLASGLPDPGAGRRQGRALRQRAAAGRRAERHSKSCPATTA